jgi:hypothetical protein
VSAVNANEAEWDIVAEFLQQSVIHLLAAMRHFSEQNKTNEVGTDTHEDGTRLYLILLLMMKCKNRFLYAHLRLFPDYGISYV